MTNDFFNDPELNDIQPATGDSDFTPLPSGSYICETVKDTYSTHDCADGTKKKKLDLQCRVLEGDNKGRIIFKTLWFTPKALPYALSQLSVMAGKKVTFPELSQADLTACPYKLKDCEATEYKASDGTMKPKLEPGFAVDLTPAEMQRVSSGDSGTTPTVPEGSDSF